MRRVSTLVVILTLLGVAPTAVADVPPEMGVQGRLTTSSGAPAPVGLKIFTFKIYDAPSGGTEIWPTGPGEQQTLSTDANGLWSAGVGSVIPLTEAVFQAPVRWLQVTVDDGINPAETLPRIELRTNPYAYRAATSQQADSVSGVDFGALFVDKSGDTMSGPLQIDFSGPGSFIPGLRANNVTAPQTAFDFGPHTFGVAGNAASDGSEMKFGTVGVASGAAGSTVGVIGETHGTGSLNIGIWGYTNKSATDNYAGYFSGGDFLVQNPSTPGTQSVILPADAISATEILDEPGLASAQGTVSITYNSATSSTMADLISVTITTPADGYIVIFGNVYVYQSGAAGTDVVVFMQIDETAGGNTTNPHWRTVGEYSRPGSSNTFDVVALQRIFFKAAGTYTLRIEAARGSITGASSVVFYNAMLTAMFLPSAYGTVATTVSASEASEFAQAVQTSTYPEFSGVGADLSVEPSFEVDLRELELKAARAKAEAERARLELLEARLRPVGVSDPASTGPREGDQP